MTNHFIDNHIQPLDLSQENANLRELLNKSMTENAELLQQVTEQQAAWRMAIDSWQKCVSENEALKFKLVEANKRIEELDATLDKVQNSWLDAKLRIDELTKQLTDAQASHHSAMILLDEAQGDCNGWHDAYVALLKWSQTAYKRLGGLMAIGVSMTPDAVTARLLSGAPANVAAEVDPFSATVDENYGYPTDGGASGIQTIEGCHSAGLHSCYGELWLCQECGNFFCDAEGSDDGFIDFCDDCWSKMQGEAK